MVPLISRRRFGKAICAFGRIGGHAENWFGGWEHGEPLFAES